MIPLLGLSLFCFVSSWAVLFFFCLNLSDFLFKNLFHTKVWSEIKRDYIEIQNVRKVKVRTTRNFQWPWAYCGLFSAPFFRFLQLIETFFFEWLVLIYHSGNSVLLNWLCIGSGSGGNSIKLSQWRWNYMLLSRTWSRRVH